MIKRNATQGQMGVDPSGACEAPGVQGGFALIATISVMVLLVMVALAMLSLSTVTMRSSQRDSAQTEARSNARLALMLAIGDLQRLAGPDTRITAPAALLVDDPSASDDSPLIAVWRSWEGLDREADSGLLGRPKLPNYNLKNEIGSATEVSEEGRFLGYLISRPDLEAWDPQSPPDLTRGEVTLLGAQSVGDKVENQVRVDPVKVENGSYAWWISGENQKARLGLSPSPGDSSEWADRMASGSYPDAAAFGIADTEELPKVASRRSLDLLEMDAAAGAEQVSQQYFNDLAPWSRGLMINASTGGFRRDLSLLTEQWDELSSEEGLPFYTLKPGEETAVSINRDLRSETEHFLQQEYLYPWGLPHVATGYGQDMGAVVPWNAVKNFCMQYRDIETSSNGVVSMPVSVADERRLSNRKIPRDNVSIRRHPQIARIQFVYSYSAIPTVPTPENPDPAPGSLTACLVVNPVVTMWNPYNVTLTGTGMSLQSFEASPIRIGIRVGTQQFAPVPLSYFMGNHDDVLNTNQKLKTFSLRKVEQRVGAQFTFKPGETKVFSAMGDEPQGDTSLAPGYRPTGGIRLTKLGSQERPGDTRKPWEMIEVTGAPGDRFEVTVDLSADSGHNVTDGHDVRGYYWNLRSKIGAVQAQPSYHRLEIQASTVEAEDYWPELFDGIVPTTLGAVAGNENNLPFVSSTFGFRMAADTSIKSKGMLQSNPLCFRSEYSIYHGYIWKNGIKPAGMANPSNSPFDLNFHVHTGWDDSLLPNADPATNRGFVVSGLDSSSGLHRCVLAELPLQPVRSLPELQHLDVIKNRLCPPYPFNVIGNSDASPLISPEAVFVPYRTDGDHQRTMQHDDSYCLNHVLFDDWFFSSIAPDMAAWTKQEDRSINDVYADFLSGEKPLPNFRYVPARSVPESQADALAQEHLSRDDAWSRIAAEIEVDGMFNVNSLSKIAWVSLLRGLRESDVPVLTESRVITEGSSEGSTPFSRTTVAGDYEAGGNNSVAGFFPEASEFAGVRALTDDQIEALAEEMVRQVRLRGPFLSLSEFVNRRLSSDSSELELAKAGAIQTALNRLSDSGNQNNPYQAVQALAEDVTAGDYGSAESAGYLFKEAALGSTAFGVPGWIRQADVLRPLAPVLSVRDDTFVIRAYGDSRNGAGVVVAKAWCEATVQRKAEFLDPADDKATLPGEETLSSEANQRFGRRFELVSFRWLSSEEV